jgi:hypothetical protein
LQLFRKLSDSFFTDHGRRLQKCSRRPRRNTGKTADELAICGQLQTLFETFVRCLQIASVSFAGGKNNTGAVAMLPPKIFARELSHQYAQGKLFRNIFGNFKSS